MSNAAKRPRVGFPVIVRAAILTITTSVERRPRKRRMVLKSSPD
jgi:hypothetical protein